MPPRAVGGRASGLKAARGHYVTIVSIAQQPGASNNPVKFLVSSWASTWEGVSIAEFLPGFVH
jgi:hypothetical protein